MTTSPLQHPLQHPAPSATLLDAVGAAVGAVVRATLDGDRDAARRVLRDGARRESLLTAAEDRARRAVVGSARPRAAVAELQLLGDVARASRQVDDLARLVLTGRASDGVGGPRREALLLLARFGEERMHQLADGPGAPELDREFVRCGRCLLDAADRLGRRVPGSGADPGAAVCACCAGLATTVLQASRHALRAAA